MSHPGEHLTPREWQIATQLVAGAGNRDIARRFRLSEQTVKAHVNSILRKTGTPTRAAAAAALRPKVSLTEMLAPIRALVEAAPGRADCRYAVPGVGRKVLIDLEELRLTLAELRDASGLDEAHITRLLEEAPA